MGETMKIWQAFLAAAAAAAALAAHAEPGADLKRGRYLLQIGGCNDCHTAGYAMSGGKVPDAKWVSGDAVGWQGPWGTTYPVNLRLYMQGLSEDEWVKKAKGMVTRPPMPWFALRDMTREDLRAVYRYIRHLGPAGEPAPAYVPPGQPAKTPVIRFPE
jgi:mono/diheme cytochrome c family protein